MVSDDFFAHLLALHFVTLFTIRTASAPLSFINFAGIPVSLKTLLEGLELVTI